ARGWAEMGRGPGACPVCLRSTVGLPTIPIPAGLPLPFRRAKSSTMPIFTPRSNPCRAPPSFSTFTEAQVLDAITFQSLTGSPFLFDGSRGSQSLRCGSRSNPCRAPPSFSTDKVGVTYGGSPEFQSLPGSPFLFDEDRSARLHPDGCKFQSLTGSPFLFDG